MSKSEEGKSSLLPADLLRQMDVPDPRYTSYPNAHRLVEPFGPEDCRQALCERAGSLRVGGVRLLSVHVQVPFCESAIRSGRFATPRGVRASREDLLRRPVIMALMCQGPIEFDDVYAAHLVDTRSHFAADLDRLAPFQSEGLVDDRGIRVIPLGWFFVREVAMVFDRHLRTDLDRARFSRII